MCICITWKKMLKVRDTQTRADKISLISKAPHLSQVGILYS